MSFHSLPWARHKSNRHNKVEDWRSLADLPECRVYPGKSSPLREPWPQRAVFCRGPFVPCCGWRGTNISFWHCCLQIFMRSSACEGNIPLNRQLPANAHWLIWIWGEGNYAAISLNLKPHYVRKMIVQYGLLMAVYHTASIYDIILVIVLYYSCRNRCTVCVWMIYILSQNEAFTK